MSDTATPVVVFTAVTIGAAYAPNWGKSVVEARLSDGAEVELFSYFSDELNFYGNEFLGKTVEECRALWFKKDQAYLQS